MKRIVGLLAIFILMGAPISMGGGVTDPLGESENRLLVQKIVQKFVRAWNDDNARAVSMLFTPNGALISPSGATANNRAGIRDLLTHEHQEIFLGTTLKKIIRTIQFPTIRVAHVNGNFTLSGVRVFLGIKTSVEGTFSFVMEKQGDSWLINQAHIRRTS
ncbi:MAG: SgcJ/EcaC family oxidoreductase [Nitrospirota bacterium]|nr:SgcJ/EcaC family oxidoreductase [Nitrospirota bacterium]